MPFRLLPDRTVASSVARLGFAAGVALLLAGCDMFGGGGGGGGLAPGLTAGMDSPSASLDRGAAFGVLNQYRGSVGAGALTDDPSLDAQAQSLAQAYAKADKAPAAPAGLVGMRGSAGYSNFAETFSGWRNSPADAAVLAAAGAHRAGLAAVYDSTSTYGVYWILVLAG